MSTFQQDSLSGVDGTGHLGVRSDHFISSADESYNHPAAGGGGFGPTTTGGNSAGGGGFGPTTTGDGSLSSGRAFGSGRGVDASQNDEQGTAEVISSYGGKKGETDFGQSSGPGEYGTSTSDNFGSQSGGTSDFGPSDPAYGVGGIGAGAGAGEALASAKLASRNDGTGEYVSGGSQGFSQNQQSSGLGGDSTNITGNPQVDGAVSDKLQERTDDDGYTNVGGDMEPKAGLTGRVKLNTDNDDSPVVETTKKRSDRDEQGRELDSYGKPYEL